MFLLPLGLKVSGATKRRLFFLYCNLLVALVNTVTQLGITRAALSADWRDRFGYFLLDRHFDCWDCLAHTNYEFRSHGLLTVLCFRFCVMSERRRFVIYFILFIFSAYIPLFLYTYIYRYFKFYIHISIYLTTKMIIKIIRCMYM